MYLIVSGTWLSPQSWHFVLIYLVAFFWVWAFWQSWKSDKQFCIPKNAGPSSNCNIGLPPFTCLSKNTKNTPEVPYANIVLLLIRINMYYITKISALYFFTNADNFFFNILYFHIQRYIRQCSVKICCLSIFSVGTISNNLFCVLRVFFI